MSNKTKTIRILHLKELFHLSAGTRTLLGVFAHPDDESLLTGGSFALGHDEGWNTLLVTITGGELGGRFTGIYGETLASIRKKELINAVKILRIDRVIQMSWPDKGVRKAQGRVQDALINIISANKPQIIVTHDPTDATQHQDHIATAQAVLDSVAFLNPTWKYKIFLAALRPDIRRHTYALDIAKFRDIKIQACRAHTSQGLFRHMQLPVEVYYGLNHFEYLIANEEKSKTNNKRYYPYKR